MLTTCRYETSNTCRHHMLFYTYMYMYQTCFKAVQFNSHIPKIYSNEVFAIGNWPPLIKLCVPYILLQREFFVELIRRNFPNCLCISHNFLGLTNILITTKEGLIHLLTDKKIKNWLRHYVYMHLIWIQILYNLYLPHYKVHVCLILCVQIF